MASPVNLSQEREHVCVRHRLTPPPSQAQYVENAFAVEFAGEPGAALTVAGIVVFVLSLAVMQEREQKHDLHVRSGYRVGEF